MSELIKLNDDPLDRPTDHVRGRMRRSLPEPGFSLILITVASVAVSAIVSTVVPAVVAAVVLVLVLVVAVATALRTLRREAVHTGSSQTAFRRTPAPPRREALPRVAAFLAPAC